jgi:hypothetical protein
MLEILRRNHERLTDGPIDKEDYEMLRRKMQSASGADTR